MHSKERSFIGTANGQPYANQQEASGETKHTDNFVLFIDFRTVRKYFFLKKQKKKKSIVGKIKVEEERD